MNLSKEIQNRLNKLHSSITLASTIDGTLPDKYSFCHGPGRIFSAEYAMTDEEFSIVLYERTDKQNYGKCFARGLFNNIDRLTSVIALWVGTPNDISKIKSQFDELELFVDFEFSNPNDDINRAWTKVKNMKFNTPIFWKDPEWEERYNEMLIEAKQHPLFKNYFPFTSHYMLRFSVDSELRETWPLGFHIVPASHDSLKTPISLDRYYVSFLTGSQFFKTAREALDFYGKKLQESRPVKW